MLGPRQQCVLPEECWCERAGVTAWPGQQMKVGCEMCVCERGRPHRCRPNPDCSGETSSSLLKETSPSSTKVFPFLCDILGSTFMLSPGKHFSSFSSVWQLCLWVFQIRFLFVTFLTHFLRLSWIFMVCITGYNILKLYQY